MRLFRPRNLLILAIIGTVVAVVMSKKSRPADPLPTVSYTPPSSSSASEGASSGGDQGGADESADESADA